ncbi:MAG TPA: MarR family transcriptional regulator [Bacillota bacterium]|nr:MarR family transcriptional regulator [Bacillota bacterium]
MFEVENIVDLVFNNLKKILYPQEWISLDLEFSKSELFTMLLVDKQGEIIMSNIADYINVSMSTANGIVERLVKNGYLIRERSDSDRRIVAVRLTDKGKKLIDDVKSTIFEYIKLIYDALDEKERTLLFKIFTKVTAILERRTRENPVAGAPNQLKKITIE